MSNNNINGWENEGGAVNRKLTDRQIESLCNAYREFAISQDYYTSNPTHLKAVDLKVKRSKLFRLLKRYETMLDEIGELVELKQ